VFNRFEYNVGDTHIDRLIQKEKSWLQMIL
jgi:hypothetical protein